MLKDLNCEKWEECVGKTKEEDPAEIIVRNVVGRLIWEQGGTTLHAITQGLCVALQTEVAAPAVIDALNYWIQQGRVGKVYAETGTKYYWGREQGRGHLREKELRRHANMAHSTMYDQRSGGKEGTKDGSPHWKAWILWV